MKASLKFLLVICLIIQIIVPQFLMNPRKRQVRLNDVESYLNTYIVKNNARTIVGNKIEFKLTFIRASHFYDRKFKFMKSITCELFFKTKQEFQFTIFDDSLKNFEMPKMDPFPYDHNEDEKYQDILLTDNDYTVNIEQKPFSILIYRTETKELLFSTKDYPLIFMNDYLELTTMIPSNDIFGLGERSFKLRLESGTYSLYNRDQFGVIENLEGGKNLYGSHPMYLTREKSGFYHVVYLRNSLPMDIIIDKSNSTLKYKILGGIFDFNFFFGDKNPETSIRMYHKYLGGYTLPSFWSMGFHQCRWGYKSLNELTDVMEQYSKNKIPLDTIWSDIDYMKNKQPFTVDEENFPIEEFKKKLKEYSKKWVMIAEPAIAASKPESSELVNKANNLDIFIKDGQGKLLYSWVWPGLVNFIDFFHSKTQDFWSEQLGKLHDKIPFSGVWLDMNELATFVDGETDLSGNKIDCNDTKKYAFLPGDNKLEKNTICPNAMHNEGKWSHMQIHNFYPVEQARLTYNFLEKLNPDEFPFILSRANAPGFGRWANHWSGDNKGTYEFFNLSVTLTYQFNLFGNPNTGSDICGFGENTPEELCAKWYQMGSLYPFSRSHNHLDYKAQEPYAKGSLLLETTRKSLIFRYSILKYYYSLFLLGGGYGTIFRPLFFEFYEDNEVLKDEIIQNQFLIGGNLMVTPLLGERFNDSMKEYFPKGDWFDLRDNSKIIKDPAKGDYVKVQGRLNEMPPVFLRAGSTIFTQDGNVANSYELSNKFILLISISHDNLSSTGFIPSLSNYNSKSKSQKCFNGDCFIHINSKLDTQTKNLSIVFTPPKVKAEDASIEIIKIVILNIDTDLFKFNESDLNSAIGAVGFLSKEDKYTITTLNRNVIDIEIKGKLELDLANEKKLNIKFK